MIIEKLLTYIAAEAVFDMDHVVRLVPETSEESASLFAVDLLT